MAAIVEEGLKPGGGSMVAASAGYGFDESGVVVGRSNVDGQVSEELCSSVSVKGSSHLSSQLSCYSVCKSSNLFCGSNIGPKRSNMERMVNSSDEGIVSSTDV